MTDPEIETERVAGLISLKLEHGTQEEKESLLRLMLTMKPREEVEAIRDSYGIFYPLP